MREIIAEISNVRRLRNAAHTLLHRSRGTPGIGMVSGPVGLGKTTATKHVCLLKTRCGSRRFPTGRRSG